MHMYHRHIPLTLLDLVFSFCDPSNVFFFDDSHSFPTAAHTQILTDTDTHISMLRQVFDNKKLIQIA